MAEAEGIYRQVLAQVPDHAEALHMLGVLACQADRADAAIDLIGRAIAITPGVAAYHNNLGESYRRTGRIEEAIASYRRAIERKPDMAVAHINLGDVLMHQGRHDEAIAAFRQASLLLPGDGGAHNRLGNALRASGRPEEAIAAYQCAIQLEPDLAAIHSNLGVSLHEAGRLDEAIAVLNRASLKPCLAEAHGNLGNVLRDSGRSNEAVAAYRTAPPAQARRCPDVRQSRRRSARHRPSRRGDRRLSPRDRNSDPATSWRTTTSASSCTKWAGPARRSTVCGRALELDPSSAETHNHLGIVLHDTGRLDEAIAAFGRAMQLRPGGVEPCYNLGNVSRDQGRLDEALACFRRAVDIRPNFSKAASSLVLTLHFHPDYDAQAILAEHLRWAEQFAEPLAAQIRPHDNDRTPDRRLRIGFVSPDFRDHPVGQSLVPLFAHHHRRQTEFVCYSDVRGADGITEKLEALADGWHPTVGRSDREVADRIRDDRIDILVDLALHTADNRLLVFARKPAPVQVTMLGMPATTGLATMDYRVTDPYLDPPGPG